MINFLAECIYEVSGMPDDPEEAVKFIIVWFLLLMLIALVLTVLFLVGLMCIVVYVHMYKISGL